MCNFLISQIDEHQLIKEEDVFLCQGIKVGAERIKANLWKFLVRQIDKLQLILSVKKLVRKRGDLLEILNFKNGSYS